MINNARCIQLGNIVCGKNWDNPQSGRVYSVNGIAPTLNTCGGGNLEPKVIVEGVGKNGADTNYSRKPREELG